MDVMAVMELHDGVGFRRAHSDSCCYRNQIPIALTATRRTAGNKNRQAEAQALVAVFKVLGGGWSEETTQAAR